jgi:DNA polymerase
MAIIELKPESISAIFAGDVSCPAASRYPFFPLNSPGMPPVGNSFVEHAAALGGDDSSQLSWYVSWLYLRALYEPGTFYMPIDVKGHSKQLRIVPGHLWGSEASGPISPKTSDDDHRPVVFIVGKAPGKEEVRDGRNLAGPAGNFLWHSFLEAGIPEDDLSCWYVTSLVRWFDPDFTGKGLPKHWIKDCLPLLHEELRLLRPDYVLCLGAESTRVLCGQSVENMVGRVLDLEIPLHESGEDPQIHTAKLMAVTHPQGVLRIPEKQPQFQKSICDFAALVKRETPKSAADDIRLQTVKTERELAEIVDKVLAQPGLKVIGLDAEWEGQKTPKDPGAYTRTIQFAPSDHYGVTVVLREAGGAPCFKPSIEAAVRQLNRLLDRDDVQIVGQFLAADIPWLDHEGVQIRKRYHAPKDFQQFRGGNYAGAFEVPIGFHAVNETEEFQLEMLAVRHVGAHRWDVVLDEYKTKYCKEHNIEESALDGYGNFDGEVLYPYGGYDAVFTRRLRTYLARPGGPLDSDRFGHDCWKPFHRAMRAYPALIEMHMMGVHVDRDRVDGITDIFLAGRSKKVEELRADINWPDFNTRSPQQCIEFLFGDKYATKIDKKTGQRVPVRPRDAVSLNMTPIKTSDKPVMPWQRVVDRHEEHLHSPSTDKEVCGNLGLVNKDALKLRDVRIVDQVLKSVMYPPTIVNGKYLLDAVGHRVYGGGISPFICYDDRVRSTFYPVTDTGRLSSSRPPLQNLSSKRESDYRRILAGLYRWPVRSFLTAGRLPDGRKTVLMEADFGGAELLMLGVMARDKVMIDHCLRTTRTTTTSTAMFALWRSSWTARRPRAG